MTYCNEKQMPCEWAQIGGGCSVSACRKVLFTAGGWPMPTKPPEFVKPPMTNADRIRAMSDEELAKRDVEIVLYVMEQLRVLNTGDKEDAIKVRLKQLQQPAEEVHHE